MGEGRDEGEITAAYVGIGDELLAGSTEDRNFLFLARLLRELGIRLMRSILVPDDLEAIREAVADCRARYDHVFISGGLGPTHDDVTVEAVARALERRVVRHPMLESRLRDLYGDQIREATLKMAEVPEGAVLHVEEGLLFPVLAVENLFLLPGVPRLFEEKLNAIKERFRSTPYHTAEILTDRRESEIAGLLVETLDRFPPIKIGSYPEWDDGGYRVRIVLESKDGERLEAAAAHLRDALAAP